MVSNKLKQIIAGAGLIAISSLASAKSIEESDWYFHVDVQSLKSSQLRENVRAEANEGLSIAESLLGKHFVDNTQYITAYGEIEKDKAKTVLARGDYGSIKPDIVKRMAELGIKESATVGSVKIYSGKVNKVDVEHESKGKSDTGDKNVDVNIHIDGTEPTEFVLYAAFLSNNTLAVGPDESEITRLADKGVKWNPEKLESLFEVVVDVEKAMVHGGVNIDEASEVVNFESISAKKLKQVSASYREYSGNIELQVGLLAADTQTATKILSVVQGLMALKVLSENNPVVVNLINSMQINQDAESLRMILAGPVESFKALIDHADI